MRNIFKKLHIGGNHDPSRSNESPSTVSPSCGSDHRASSGVSSSSSSPPTDAASVNTPATNPAPPAVNRQDYYSSEEEYQVQLALALSVSGTDGPEGSDEERIRALSMMSLGRQGASNSVRERDDKADSLSRQYWDYGVLDYDEKVVEGFYDIYGLCTDRAVQGKMPSLAELETKPGTSGFEVIIVNRRIDPSLEELLQIARCIYLDCSVGEVNIRVQRLAELVTDHLGGPVKDANTILAKWVERSTDLTTSLHTTVLPIGSLNIGLSRHRALLFKVVADNVDLPCRLVKGSHYTGVEDDAVNIIKLKNESEFLVDLMGAPGTLIPADILSTKDMTLNPNAPNLSKLPTFQTGHDSEIFYPVLKPLLGDVEGSKSSVAESSLHLGQKSNSANAESSLPHASGEGGVGSSGTLMVAPLNPHATSSHTGILYKGGRGSYASGDGSRMNVNMVPCSQSATEDSRNLFAHLNPFQVKGAGRGSVEINQGWNKANEPRKPRNDLPSGRPPAPLNWKNRQPCNEVSKKKESDFLEELFPRSSQETNDSISSSLSFSSSSNVSEIVHSDTSKLRSSAYPKHRDCGDRNPFLGSNTILDPKKNQFERLSSEESSNMLSKDKYFKDEKVWKNDQFGMAKDHGKKVTGIDDHRKPTNDRLIRTNNKLKDPEHSSSLFGSGAGQIDPLMDDVGECEILWEDLVIGERIGLGSYGEVYRADWNGTEVAVKKFLDQDFSGDALAEFRREVRIMRRLRHQNVVTFMGAVTRPPNLSIVTEFLPRGSLYRIIHRPNCPIDEKRRIKMALDVAEGMNCLHTSKPTIVHRDLKSPNLLVDNNWNVKVGDFGLSRLKHNTFLSSKSTAGTPEWMAPEVLRNEPSNEKCDVYSFGVILWELATLRLPWSGMNPMQVVGAVGFQNRRLDISKDIDPLVARMIWECWQTDPNLRPSFAQLIVALKPLQRLVLPSHLEQQNSTLPQEISVNSTP